MTSSAKILVACLSGSLFTAGVCADVVTSGCAGGDFGDACSLRELINGGSLRIHDKIFDEWFLSELGFGGAARPATVAGEIRIDPLDSPSDPGVSLVDTGTSWRLVNDGSHPIDGDGVASLFDLIGFRVRTIDGRPLIKDNTLAALIGDVVDNLPGDTTSVSVVEELPDLGINKVARCGLDPHPDPGTCAHTTLTDHRDFAPVNQLLVKTTIGLRADSRGDVAELDRVTMRFSQIGEPAMPALVMAAILAAGLARRSRRHQAQV